MLEFAVIMEKSRGALERGRFLTVAPGANALYGASEPAYRRLGRSLGLGHIGFIIPFSIVFRNFSVFTVVKLAPGRGEFEICEIPGINSWRP